MAAAIFRLLCIFVILRFLIAHRCCDEVDCASGNLCTGLCGYSTGSGWFWLRKKQIPVLPFKLQVGLTVVQYASVFKQRKPLMKETKHGCMYSPLPRFEILVKKDVNSRALELCSTRFDASELPEKIKYSKAFIFGLKNKCVCNDRWLLLSLKCLGIRRRRTSRGGRKHKPLRTSIRYIQSVISNYRGFAHYARPNGVNYSNLINI